MEDLFDALLAAGEDTNRCERQGNLFTRTSTSWSATVADENGDTFVLYLDTDHTNGRAWLSNGRNRVSPMAHLSYTIPQEAHNQV